jgi:hypothetical protein
MEKFEIMKKKWNKAKDKKIELEFRQILLNMLSCNGGDDLIDVVEGIPTIKQKRDFIIGYHEQDE